MDWYTQLDKQIAVKQRLEERDLFGSHHVFPQRLRGCQCFLHEFFSLHFLGSLRHIPVMRPPPASSWGGRQRRTHKREQEAGIPAPC